MRDVASHVLQAHAQWSAAAACRLRLARIQAEFRPVRTMRGHKNVQTRAHSTRPPTVELPVGASAL